MRKLPMRPTNEISQDYNDGIVTIYGVEDIARPGELPVEELTQKATLRYAELQLGINRYYAARQNQIRIERVLRIPQFGHISNQDVAVTEDGRRYRIDLIQSAREVYPPSLDLTLVKYDQTGEADDELDQHYNSGAHRCD